MFVYAFNRNKIAKLYLPGTFKTSDIELVSPKIEDLEFKSRHLHDNKKSQKMRFYYYRIFYHVFIVIALYLNKVS